MFGLFNKKDKDEEKRNHPEFLELVEKWETFLQKIETRFNESLTHAEEALMDNLEVSDFDIAPTLRSWDSIKTQIHQLADKIETTFDDTVKDQMLEYIEEWDVIDQEHKGTELSESIYLRLDRFEIVIEGKVSQKFYDHAITLLNESFNCTQCNAQLEVKKDIFRSHYVSCQYCNTVNTFMPSDKITKIAWVAGNIAKYNALSEWDAMKKAENDYHSLPCKADHEDKTELKAAFEIREEKERLFWKKYFKERYSLLPQYEDTFDHDVEVKMRYLYEEKEREF